MQYDRRTFFKAAGAATLVATASGAALASGTQMDHSSHSGMDHSHMHAAAAVNAALQKTALACIEAGQLCLNHCLSSFAAGDLSMAGCARSVDQMLAVCAALAKLASTGSPLLAAMAKAVALPMCLECEQECRKHADRHAECKACADACKACAEECRKLAA